jgi:hypothetical protein
MRNIITHDTPLLIVGAGIGGLLAALSLTRARFPVHVLEQASELKEIGAGIQLGPNVFRMFDLLGIKDAVAKYSAIPSTTRSGAEPSSISRAYLRWTTTVIWATGTCRTNCTKLARGQHPTILKLLPLLEDRRYLAGTERIAMKEWSRGRVTLLGTIVDPAVHVDSSKAGQSQASRHHRRPCPAGPLGSSFLQRWQSAQFRTSLGADLTGR